MPLDHKELSKDIVHTGSSAGAGELQRLCEQPPRGSQSAAQHTAQLETSVV